MLGFKSQVEAFGSKAQRAQGEEEMTCLSILKFLQNFLVAPSGSTIADAHKDRPSPVECS